MSDFSSGSAVAGHFQGALQQQPAHHHAHGGQDGQPGPDHPLPGQHDVERIKELGPKPEVRARNQCPHQRTRLGDEQQIDRPVRFDIALQPMKSPPGRPSGAQQHGGQKRQGEHGLPPDRGSRGLNRFEHRDGEPSDDDPTTAEQEQGSGPSGLDPAGPLTHCWSSSRSSRGRTPARSTESMRSATRPWPGISAAGSTSSHGRSTNPRTGARGCGITRSSVS